MSVPNLPPGPEDDVRLIIRTEQLERRFQPTGPDTFADQRDVNADFPNDGDVPIFNATTGKWENGPMTASGGFPLTKDDGFATTKIDSQHVASGGGDITTFTENIHDHTGSPKPRWDVIAVVADGPATGGGAQFFTEYQVRTQTIDNTHLAELVLTSSSGADADFVTAELRLEPVTFLGFDLTPYPHVLLEAGADPSGSPAYGRITIESAAFGPVAIKIGGPQGDLIGFFDTTPVVQQATPTNTATIIALLQAYGLCP